MLFETINTKSKELAKQKSLSVCTMSIKERGFYFSKEACKRFGIKQGLYLHLVRGLNNIKLPNGLWYFVVNNMETGFKITTGSHDAALVFNKVALRFFMREVKCRMGDCFYLEETKSEHDGCKVVEIMMKKP